MTLLEGRSDEIGDGPALGTIDTKLRWSIGLAQGPVGSPFLVLPFRQQACPALSRTPGFPDLFTSSTMEISAAATSNCSRRVAIAASNVQATKKTLCRRCRICARNPPWSFCSSQLFFPLSRTAVARIGEALSTLTHPLAHAKWRQRADIAIPFQVSLTSMRRLDARKASTGSCPSKPP